jgi:hypothetical protein
MDSIEHSSEPDDSELLSSSDTDSAVSSEDPSQRFGYSVEPYCSFKQCLAGGIVIPLEQRSYSPDPKQLSLAASGVLSSMQAGHAPYKFMNTLLLVKNSSTRAHEVHDGQHRIVGIALLLAAIRDQFRQADAGRLARAVDSVLFRGSSSSSSSVPLLRYEDERVDTQLLQLLRGTHVACLGGDVEKLSSASASTDPFLKPYACLRLQVQQQLAGSGAHDATRLVRTISSRVMFVVAQTLDPTAGRLQFLTANSGKPVNNYDKARNTVLLKAGSDAGRAALAASFDSWEARLSSVTTSAWRAKEVSSTVQM